MMTTTNFRRTRATPAFDSGIIAEPLLLFGGRKEHIDPKTGLSLFGPYNISGQSGPNLTSATVGIIGSGSMIADAQQWLKAIGGSLTNSGDQPFLYPHFPGFNLENPFRCELAYGETWNEVIKQSELSAALSKTSIDDRINEVINLYGRAMLTLSQREPRPTVVMLCLPQEIIDQCLPKIDSPLIQMPSKEVESESTWRYENLRRGLKCEAMRYNLPTQIVWPRAITLSTVEGARGNAKAQDLATRAWNFTTALYHKAGGSPWRVSRMEQGVCFVGISFYKEKGTSGRMRTSMAQAFTSAGDGYVLRGNPFHWDERKDGRSPHLDQKGAAALLNDVIALYKKQSRGSLPNRIVIHKSSRFSAEEIAGFDSACEMVPRKDYVAIGWRDIQLYRTGNYPPLRGTYVKFSDNDLLFYTSGYVPFLRTFPGMRIPQPLEILEHHGDSPWLSVLEEIMALTKMNWNTADFSNGLPITLAFSQKVGRILSELPPNIVPRPEYRYYM